MNIYRGLDVCSFSFISSDGSVKLIRVSLDFVEISIRH